MDKQKIQQILHEIAARAFPRRPDRWPVMRLVWIGVALLAIFAAGAGVYAAAPVITRLLGMDERVKDSGSSPPGYPLDLSQTAGPVTVTVEWAYADPDRILVGYILRSSDGRRYEPSAVLTGPDGAVYGSQGEYEAAGQSDLLQLTLPAGEGSYIGAFPQCLPDGQAPDEKSAPHCYPIRENAVTSYGGPQTLRLHLTIHASELIQSPSSTTPPASGDSPSQPQTQSAGAQPVTPRPAIGPFTFDFNLPLTPSQP